MSSGTGCGLFLLSPDSVPATPPAPAQPPKPFGASTFRRWPRRVALLQAAYAGDGQVLHAPRTGRTIELTPLDTAMPSRDYRGATRA
ncbi:hypothetical protein Slala04_12330 [Streptomyces lavendulae subsp. lavendulae]|nr:hypothetical protein Slala04_12330 [Streptomyces lavendulae subsp. lavendulae]